MVAILVNHSDCVFLSVSASVLVLAPDGGRPSDSHLTLLLQLQTGRNNGSIDSLRLVGSVSFLCEVCFFFNVMDVNGSELYFVVSQPGYYSGEGRTTTPWVLLY